MAVDDGNTAKTTKIYVNLIKKFHAIMIVVAFGHGVDTVKFRKFSYGTAKFYVEFCPRH